MLNLDCFVINYKCLSAVCLIRCLKRIPSINQFNIKKLLKKENLKIEELLDEESISDEINNEKSPIHKFLTEENLSKVLDYLMKDQSTEDQKKAYKFPKVAESVLSSKATGILQFFQAENTSKKLENFEQLFSFAINFKQQSIIQEEINFTRASYVKTVVVSLLQNQPQTFATYLFSQELILDALLAHAYSKSVQFILKSLLQVPHKEDENPNEIDQNVERESVTVWITEIERSKIHLLEKILQILITSTDSPQALFQSNNLTQVFLEYVKASYGGHEKVTSLKHDYLQSIQEYFFNNIKEKRARNLSKIFIELVQSQNQKEEDKKHLFEFFKKLLDFQKQIFQTKNKKLSTFGKDHFIVAPNLIYTISITFNIFSKNKQNQEFVETFDESYASFLFSLFEQFPLNNILHQKIDLLLSLVAETDNKELFTKFFNNKSFSDLKENLAQKESQKINAYQGFLLKLIALLEQSQFAEILYDDKNHEKFMQNFYFPKIEQQNKSLGGVEQDNSAPHAEFYFSVEEIEEKYKTFLQGENIADTKKDEKQQNGKKKQEESKKSQEEEEDLNDKKISQQVQKHLMKEIKQINESDEDLHFQDQTYWKPRVDTDLDSLMAQLSQKV